MQQRELVEVGRITKTRAKLVHGTQNSSKENWYTPEEYIRSARFVMGSIDLDPASSGFANDIVQATVFYDQRTNGLSKPWRGNVWLNPPYTTKLIDAFVDKLLVNLEKKRIKHAILLTHNRLDTLWCHKAMRRMVAMIITRGRIRFYDENGKANSPTHGHIFMYFSGNCRPRRARFVHEFSKYGYAVEGIH